MAHWIQLKDGIAFAHVESEGFVGNSILLEDSETPSEILGKEYVEGQWVTAPLISYIEEMDGDTVMRIGTTVFSSDVKGEIVSGEVKHLWTKIASGKFIPPAPPTPVYVQTPEDLGLTKPVK